MKTEELKRRLTELNYKGNVRSLVKADLVKEYLDLIAKVNFHSSF